MPIANGRTPPPRRDEVWPFLDGGRVARQSACSWLSALGVCGLPFDGSKFRPARPLRRGTPGTIVRPLSARPSEPCDALGRSQVVRQRILIPPSGGSNPPAPATYSLHSENLPHAAQSPVSRGLLPVWRLKTARNGCSEAQLAVWSLAFALLVRTRRCRSRRAPIVPDLGVARLRLAREGARLRDASLFEGIDLKQIAHS